MNKTIKSLLHFFLIQMNWNKLARAIKLASNVIDK